jgi:hypothetical protein
MYTRGLDQRAAQSASGCNTLRVAAVFQHVITDENCILRHIYEALTSSIINEYTAQTLHNFYFCKRFTELAFIARLITLQMFSVRMRMHVDTSQHQPESERDDDDMVTNIRKISKQIDAECQISTH